MAKRDRSSFVAGRERQLTLLILVAVFFTLLVARLFTLQVIRHDEYSRFAKNNQLKRERVAAPRGYFLDRNGEILVDNVLHFQVVMSWRERDDVAAVATGLWAYLPVDTSKIMAHFDAWKKKHGRMAFPIVPDADKFIVSFIKENADSFPELRVISRARRRYRGGELAAHLLGFVGEVGDREISEGANSGKRYFPGDMVGKSALEAYSEDVLRGVDGQDVFEVNASGRIMGEFKKLSTAPTPGRNLILTIDARLQRILEEALSQHGPSAAVVIDTDDGSVIAAVSLPQFDPNEFATGISQASLDRLFNAKSKPLFNRFSQARYPPASTFKIVSAYAALTNELVRADHVLVYCAGGHQFGNRYFRCWQELGHGYMNLLGGVIQSCDTYFYKVAEIMDVDMLASSARAFGFGEKTGIDLPAEVRGLVPDRAYYDRRFGKGKWTQGLVLNNIIGQGENLASLLQVVRMCAAVANGGFLVTPHVIDHIEGEPRVAYPRRRIPHLSGATLRFLRSALEGVVSHPKGTAQWTRLDWMKTAGKTGTAENPHGEPHSWYVAYAPADDPEIAIAVIVENAGHGSDVAAPIVRDFFREYFRPGSTAAVGSDVEQAATGGGGQ